MKKIMLLIVSLIACISIEQGLKAAAIQPPQQAELTAIQREASEAAATAIFNNNAEAVKQIINNVLAQDFKQNPEIATQLALALFKVVAIKLIEFGDKRVLSMNNEAGKQFDDLILQPYAAQYFPRFRLLRIDQLPKLTKDELIIEINKTKDMLPGHFLEALTISDDNKILVVGDIHGSLDEIIATINLMRKERFIKSDNPWKLQDKCFLIFTGDYEDYGSNGLEVWHILMKLVQTNPEHCLLLRGNHEMKEMAYNYEFRQELERKYGEDKDDQLLNSFDSLFDKLPSALFLGIRQPDNTVRVGIYCHGGLEPRISPDNIKNLITESIRQQDRLIGKSFEEIKIITIDGHEFVLKGNGFLWSDFKTGSQAAGSFEWNINRNQGYIIYPLNAIALLMAYSTPQAKVDYFVKGHQHLPGCVNALFFLKAPLTEQKGRFLTDWILLSHEQLIQPYSVLMFMCLKPGLPGFSIKDTQAGFGLIKSDQNHQLTIEPHIARDFSIK